MKTLFLYLRLWAMERFDKFSQTHMKQIVLTLCLLLDGKLDEVSYGASLNKGKLFKLTCPSSKGFTERELISSLRIKIRYSKEKKEFVISGFPDMSNFLDEKTKGYLLKNDPKTIKNRPFTLSGDGVEVVFKAKVKEVGNTYIIFDLS